MNYHLKIIRRIPPLVDNYFNISTTRNRRVFCMYSRHQPPPGGNGTDFIVENIVEEDRTICVLPIAYLPVEIVPMH